MIGYDAMWGVKRVDARAAYQKPGRVMFMRQTRIGGLHLPGNDLATFYKGENDFDQDKLVEDIFPGLGAGLGGDTDGQPVPQNQEILVIVDWEKYAWDSGTAIWDESGLQDIPSAAQYDAILQWMWPQIVAQWRILRPMARWTFYQCVQHHTWGGPLGGDGWFANQQENRTDKEAQEQQRGPWVSRRQGDPDSYRGWLYDLVDVLAVHCYHNRLYQWDANSFEQTIRDFHRDECRHGAWLSQTRYGGRKPVMPYVAWRAQGIESQSLVANVAGGETQITLSPPPDSKDYADDLYKFAVFKASLDPSPLVLNAAPAVRVQSYDAGSRVVTLRSPYTGILSNPAWTYKIDAIPCRTQDAKSWLEGYDAAAAARGGNSLTPWAMWAGVADDEAVWTTLGTLDERISPAIAQHFAGKLGFVPALRVSS